MKTPFHWRGTLALLLAATIAMFFWWIKTRSRSDAEAPSVDRQSARETHVTVSTADPVSAAFSRFAVNRATPDSLQSLIALRNELQSQPRTEAVKWIDSFLTQGRDKPTGLSFVIGRDHAMMEWPTFRSFLIDALLAIDPPAAAQISRKILETPTSPDEWALALRNVGNADSSAESHEYLRTKTEELITNPAWQAAPSIGYLNAFDVLVHTNATASTPLLSSLIQHKDRKDLAHAAFLTLDRLVQRNPADVLACLAEDTTLAQSRPEMVAQQFARADLRDPVQREIARDWLLNPIRTVPELRAFASAFPNNNRFVSNNLLSDERTQTATSLAEVDYELLEIINSWNEDSSFVSLKSQLEHIKRKLAHFVTPPKSPAVGETIGSPTS